MVHKRKHILLKTEIEMLQIFLRGEGFPSEEYKLKLANRLEDLKKLWYKVRKQRSEK